MELHLDNSIPVWGLFGALGFGAFYLIKMYFELDGVKKELKDLKELIHELILKK